jgi:hypothetical protein
MTAIGLALLIGGYSAACATAGLKSVLPMVGALAIMATGSVLIVVGLIVWLWRIAP